MELRRLEKMVHFHHEDQLESLHTGGNASRSENTQNPLVHKLIQLPYPLASPTLPLVKWVPQTAWGRLHGFHRL